MSDDQAVEKVPSEVDTEVYTTTRKELWSYYLYYIGNNGLSGFNFGPSQFQNLLYLAGYDPKDPPFVTPCDDNCVFPYLGHVRDINSIVLLTNGISFAIQAAFLICIGAWADYGRWRPNITIFFTLAAVGVSFAWLGVDDPSRWRAGIVLYILGLITYQCALTFWTAAFPGLARDLPEVKGSLTELNDGHKRECLRLKQTFLYLIFYFLMGDVLNTTVTVIGTLQNRFVQSPSDADLLTPRASSVVAYSTLQLTLLLIVGIVTQGMGIYLFWLVQKRYSISTKAMLLFNVFWIIVLTIWGLIGVHTDKFGFKHVWEIWFAVLYCYIILVTSSQRLYQAFYGLLVCPWYAYSQTMISEVSPLSQMFLFFALFSVVGKTSAFIGPFVSSAIITASNNNDNMPFAFLFALGVFSSLFLWLVDVEKSRVECAEFVQAEAKHKAFESDFDTVTVDNGNVDEKVKV
ncbi:related to autophagy protein (Atg22) [Armillaria ostoyae]|uniref:Autophagy-related protein n=1 Tax=Armillaria ostoyae TaxID=47428 RepID=A0A284SDG0_ARMOS|nr:related to autophagy protein (Atg22) [Armillaria ostoyae]